MKKFLSVLLTLVMIIGMMPYQTAAATDLTWNGGKITLASGTKVGSYTLTTFEIYKQNATSNYPEIVGATQDGNTINITLAEGTNPSYPLQMGFAGNGGYIQQTGNTCTLKSGKGTATVTVSAKPAPQPNAPVLGTGTFTVNFSVEVGEVYDVTIPDGEGFTFEGETTAGKNQDYSFTVNINEGYDGSAMVVKVNGTEMTGNNGVYTVTDVTESLVITIEGIAKKEVLSVTAPTGEGFTFSGNDTVYKTEDYVFTISVDGAFNATDMVVKANETVLVGNKGKYTVSAVSENIVITVEGVVPKTIYTVTLTEGEGYTLKGQDTSYAGEPYTFTVSVDDSIYWADKIEVLVDGEKVTLTNGKHTFGALDGDKTVTVQNILERQILTVTKTEFEGVVINGDDTVREGKAYTFTVTVNEKYDGTNMVVTVNGKETTSADNQYTVDTVTEDITIEISGIVKKDICEIIRPADGKFIFTGNDFAYKGNDYVFTVKPSLGYVAVVTVNGVTVEGTNDTYTVKAETDEMTILVSTEKVAMPGEELGITVENDTYTVDVADNKLSPFSSYHTTVTDIKISGARVVSAYESGTTIYFNLHSDTPDTAGIDAEFLYSNKNCTLKYNTLDIILKDGEAGVTHTVTADYSNGWKTKSATYTLIFFREIPAEEPPVCIKNSDTKEVWKDRNLEIDLSEYFADADTYYLVNEEGKTEIEGKIYTFTSSIAGEHTLSFAAENEAGEATERLTVTVTVKDIKSGVYIGRTTGNGSWNHIQFCDTEGNLIEGIEVTYDMDNRVVSALLPKTYDAGGKVLAKFDMTQNEAGYPFVSASTETTGNRAFNSRFTEKNIALTGGSATFTFYYYNSSTGATNNGGQTKFAISIKIKNDKPVLTDGIEASTNASITAGENYTLDLSPLFTDVDADELTYKVSINGADAASADTNYFFTTDVAGTYTLVFSANDGKDDSEDTFTVILTVENSTETDCMTVYVPEGLTPKFYISSGFADGAELQGDSLDAVEGETEGGLTSYALKYPVNADMLSIRTEEFGGMAFDAKKDGSVTFRKVQLLVVDYDNHPAESTNMVTYGENTAVAGSNGWLVAAGYEYTITATPQNADLAKVSETLAIEAGADTYIIKMMLGISNPVRITVPTGAKAQLYKYNQYYSNTELVARIIKDNGDGTTTYQFVADTKNQNGTSYIYRVSMEGKITKSGWLAWNQQNLTVAYTENDKASSYRLDDYSMTGEENSSIAEDSVLLNGNSRNHLNVAVGQSRTLKAYRAWEIIAKSYQNYIISPDFTYTILQGKDVVSLTEKDSPSAGEGDWMTLTALKDGIAIIEVTYDAIEISGGDYDGIYGASDPDRSGLLVVQVGEKDDTSVKFGIESFSSFGTSGTKNISYNANRQKEWDSEFDTLYFTGNSGSLTFMPTASSEITEVSVSHDKGATWINLTGEDGVYTAAIVQGNNIIRVKTENGTAYQVVRGDKVTVKFAEVSGKSDDDGIVEASETIRVTLVGLHSPIPKMAGNYNPGYGGNMDGYSSQHLNYTCNGTDIYGPGLQYNFITGANYVEFVMPADGSDVTLHNGYIGTGVIGLANFSSGGDSHRNIPDNGCATRGSETTFHTQSILPDISVKVGDTSAPNNAPIVRKDAACEKEIYSDQNFAINPDTLFADPDDDTLTFTVSVNGGEAAAAPLDYKFTPNGTGTYTLLFTATDGKETAQHTITLTVTKRPSQGGSQDTPETEDEFGLTPSEIAGYVTISFADNGVRVKGESGLTYPKALGTIIPATKVPYKKGEKITHVTKRLLDTHGIRMSYTGTLESGFYLGAICDFELNGTPYDSFGEFDAGVGSGWMITLNKKFIEYGASEFEVKNGDVIKWQYTCQLGKDIGDPFYSGSSSSNKNNKTEEKKGEETKTETSQKVETTTNVTEDKTTVITTENSIQDAISKAEKENIESIVISSTDTKDATNITLEIPASAAQNIAENSNLSLEVETASGNVTISNETLNSIVEQVGTDENLKVTVEIINADKVLEAVNEESAKVITESVEKEILQNAVIVEVNITSGDKYVRNFGGNKLTVDIPVEGKGHEEGKYYKVHIVSSDGRMDTSFGECVARGGKLVIKIDTTHLSSFIVTDIETCPFGDVPNHWAYESIKYVYEHSLMQGTDEATFAPDANMTRAMLVTVLYRMANPEATESTHNFEDVPDGEWYSDAVIWAAANGMVSGVSRDRFAPNEDITREQLALIIYRFAKMQGIDTTGAANLEGFTDASDVSDWSLDAIKWANFVSLVNGTSDTTLSPKDTATRGQVAEILMRFCENIAK